MGLFEKLLFLAVALLMFSKAALADYVFRIYKRNPRGFKPRDISAVIT